ncbi:MAG: ribulose-phosphate 3-epimerase [FCB group bacterium]|nr:ribulose-phosphate 3-epimerase [FCB group bacterium]
MAKIAPSILGADFGHLAEEIHDTVRVGADWLHLDIMDGHFVPNISFGPSIVKTIDNLTDKFLDVHLMLSEPEKYFEPFVKAGADSITFHIEVHPQPMKFLEIIKNLGVKTGLSLNPDTDIEKVLPYLEYADFLLIMSVFPGFGGQEFIEKSLERITVAKKYIISNNLKTKVAVDGGINGENAAQVVTAGADVLVIGSAFFKSSDRYALTKKVQSL